MKKNRDTKNVSKAVFHYKMQSKYNQIQTRAQHPLAH